MSEYNMTQLSMKQNLLETHIKSLKRLNNLLVDMIVNNDMDMDIMNTIQDICKEIQECATRIKDAGGSVSNYAFFAGLELKKEKQVKETKTLKPTLDSWDATKVANAIAEAGTILPVVDNVEEAVGNG
ncbi:MAG: hypothetical protein UHM56_01705 [Phascolarctobacterium sp.]|nr:hypothetical protein [Phascolarctobacterium sp.]